MEELKPVVFTVTSEMKHIERMNDLFFFLVQFSMVICTGLLIWVLFEYFRNKSRN